MPLRDKSDDSSRGSTFRLHSSQFTGIVTKPLYGDDYREYTTFAPVGPQTADNTDFLPWRNSDAPGDIGVGGPNDWLWTEDVFEGGTDKTVSFLAAEIGPDGMPIDNGFEPSVAHEFIRLVSRGVKDTVDELKFKKPCGASKFSPPLRRVRTHGFVQGMLLRRGKDDHTAAPQYPAILHLSPNAKDATIASLEARDENGDFVAEGMLSVAGGKAFNLYADKPEKPTSAGGGTAPKFAAVSAVDSGPSSQGKGKSSIALYCCDIVQRGFAMPLDGEGKIAIPGLFTPWTQALNYITREQQIDLLVQAYRDCPHILKMGLGHIPGALPKSVSVGQTISTPAPAAAPAAPAAAAPAPAAPAQEPKPEPTAAEIAAAEGAKGAAKVAASTVAPTFAPVAVEARDDGEEAAPAPTMTTAPASADMGQSPEVQDALSKLKGAMSDG